MTRLSVRSPRAIAAACAVTAASAATLGAIGVALDEPALAAFVTSMHAITGVTAAALVLLSLALWLACTATRWRIVLSAVAAGGAAALGLFGLASYASGRTFGAGEFLDNARGPVWGPFSPQSGVAIVLLGAALLVMRRRPLIAQGAALSAMVIAAAAVIAIAFDVRTFLGIPGVPGTSLPGAIAIGALAVGVIALTTDAGVGRLFVTHTRGGKFARQGLAVALGGSIALAVGVFVLNRTVEFVSVDVAASIYLLGSLVIATGLVLRLGFILDRVDTARAATVHDLVASESRARELIEHAPEAIVVFDVALGRFVRVNAEAERLFGLPGHELMQRGLLDLSTPLQRGRRAASVLDEHIDATMHGAVPVFEWIVRTPAGKRIDAEVRLLRLPDASRDLIRGSFVDVGPRKRAEAALRTVDRERAARAVAEADRDRIATLQRITAQLMNASSVDDVAAMFVEVIVPDLGAKTGLIFTLENGSLVRRGHTADAADAEWEVVSLDAATTSAAAARTGDPVVLRSIEDAESSGFLLLADAMREFGYASFASLPTSTGEHRIGVASLGYAERLGDEDVAFLRRVAERVGHALERAQLFEGEQRARRQLEHAAERTEAVQRVIQALARASTPDEVVECTATLGIEAFGARASTAGILDPEAGEYIVRTYGFPVDREPWYSTFPLAADLPGPASVRSERPLFFRSGAEMTAAFPATTAFVGHSGFGATACVPLIAWGRPLGFLAVHYEDEREFTEVDRVVFATLASISAQALERAQRFAIEHETASVLQQSMLPASLPDLPNLSIAARYASAGDLEVGGDWYDALALDDGSLIVTVGDVVGRGLDSAASMGQLRSAINALSLADPNPSDVLDRLDRFASSIHGARLATVAIARLHRPPGPLVYASAGHVPAVLVLPGGSTQLLEPETSFPLDAVAEGGRDDVRVDFPPGSTLVLYTDGLIERRGESLDVGLRQLMRAAGALHETEVEVMCDRIMAELLPSRRHDDDVALLCLRRERAASMVRSFPALPQELAPMRQELREWLADAGLSTERAADLILAVDEACANAVEHAYGFDAQCEVVVEVACTTDEEVVARVSDTGAWRVHKQDGDRGRGLGIIRAIVDDCEIRSDATGTTVLLTQRMRAPG